MWWCPTQGDGQWVTGTGNEKQVICIIGDREAGSDCLNLLV